MKKLLIAVALVRHGWGVSQPLRHERRRHEPLASKSWSSTITSFPPPGASLIERRPDCSRGGSGRRA
jgi:hypothetical protein